MGLPHSGQIGIGPSAAMCLALHLRRAAPFWYRPEPALLLMFPSCVFGGLGEIRIRERVSVFTPPVVLSQHDRLGLYRTQAVTG